TSVTTSAAAMAISLTNAGRPSDGGSRYRQIAMICSSVFSLPPWLAAITPRLSTAKRSAVMPNSRARIRPVTHQGSSPITDRVISAAPVSALSAIGSAILPKSVTRPRLRASCPSRKSVADAPQNAASAANRQPVPPCTRQNTKTGTRKILTTVSTLATLTRPTGAGAGTAAPRGLGPDASFTTVTGSRASDQIGAHGLHHPCGHEVAGSERTVGEQRRRPVHVRCLVRGAALVPAVAALFDQHRLLDEAGELADPAGHLVLVKLDAVGERRGLGAVLVGVAEDPDRVQPGLVQEQLKLPQVLGRLAREADDEVGPHARVRGELPDPLDQLGEPRAVAEA